MSFDVLTGGVLTLNLDRAPVVLGRYDKGGPARYVDYGLDGQPVVTEYSLGGGAPDRPELRLQLTLLTADEVEMLDSILNAGGVITVLTTATASPVVCVAAPRSEQKIEPMAGAYRDDMAIDALMLWKAELLFIRL